MLSLGLALSTSAGISTDITLHTIVAGETKSFISRILQNCLPTPSPKIYKSKEEKSPKVSKSRKGTKTPKGTKAPTQASKSSKEPKGKGGKSESSAKASKGKGQKSEH